MNRLLDRVLAVAGVFVLAMGGLFVLSPAALAASSNAIVYTDGTRAGEVWFNRSNGTRGNRAWFDLYDAKCDKHSVYVEYSINNGADERKKNDGGCGTTRGFNLRTGYFAIVYRVCVDDTFGNHPCSGWRSDHN
ncbi:hypothetical protein ETD86_27115 [Nonomuraea turkmeniaca]|uniref:Secreted protein n=1 Tax=Nonomuraea turkmeniaca TaxID=103838 RepID=A0A5S4FBT5_9ACTN|nr:hypothetical protein [Nonomuraea turkmeniaca]TMR15452.1 hypothetical protein ETD86_27115 [Nonomuraea turkmeniaca]